MASRDNRLYISNIRSKPSHRRPSDGIASYAFYGEEGGDQVEEVLHCETLRARAVKHDWRFRPHRHPGMHQFFCVRRGQGLATIDGAERRFGSQSALSIPPMVVHGFVFQPGIEGWVVTIPSANLRAALSTSNSVATHLSAPLVLPCGAAGETLFATIAEEFDHFDQEREQALASLVGLLAVWFAREKRVAQAAPAERPDPGRELVQRFMQLVEAELPRRRPLTALAASLGITPTHLSRVCRQLTGRSASTLLQDRLTLEARRLLTYTSKGASEVGYALGFHDPAHFSKFFRRQTGKSPAAYRATRGIWAERGDRRGK
jgi:AraC family transcriptional activator of pobA